ncbi:hypothetical protein D3C87_2034690 [compost metagenome]
MQKVVCESVRGEFTCNAISWTAHTGAFGVTALNHKAGNHAMENRPVVEALLNQGDKVVYGVGSNFGIELGFDNTAVIHLNGDDRMAGRA